MRNKIELRPCHDKRAIELLTDNDVVEVGLADADELVKRLQYTIEAAKAGKDLAPAPLDFSKEWPDVGVTECGRRDGSMEAASILGHDFTIEMAKQLHDWLGNVIIYHEAKA